MKVELNIPDNPKVGDPVSGTITAIGTSPPTTPPTQQPPVNPTPPTQPPIGGWTPPADAVILGSIANAKPLMPNSGQHQVRLTQLGVMYAWQLGADARDAGFSCPSGYCTAGINGNYTAQGMDTAQVLPAGAKRGDWLCMFIGLPGAGGAWGHHNYPADALVSAH